MEGTITKTLIYSIELRPTLEEISMLKSLIQNRSTDEDIDVTKFRKKLFEIIVIPIKDILQ